jgi:hypothetical protein
MIRYQAKARAIIVKDIQKRQGLLGDRLELQGITEIPMRSFNTSISPTLSAHASAIELVDEIATGQVEDTLVPFSFQ